MVNISQRIQELRTERGLSRAELSIALGLPKNAAEKFETGRQTPTQEQQNRIADFFGVSLFYLRGESNDRTRQEDWMTADFQNDEDEPPRQAKPKPRPDPPKASGQTGGGSLMGSFLNNRDFQEMIRSSVAEFLRSKEGQDMIARVVKKELEKR